MANINEALTSIVYVWVIIFCAAQVVFRMTRRKKTCFGKFSEALAAFPSLVLGGFLLALPFHAHAQSIDDTDNQAIVQDEQALPGNDMGENQPVAVEDTLAPDPEPQLDGAAIDSAMATQAARDNLRQPTIDGLAVVGNADRDQAPGVAIGTMTLRPSVSQNIGVERSDDGKTNASRLYLQTALKGALTSDWSSHQLTVNGEGNFFRTISGQTNDDPTFKIDALLRLDVTRDTTANLKAGFSHARETATSANAIEGASVQAGIDQYLTGADIRHDFGRLRATIGADLVRSVYSDAVLANGMRISQADRDNIGLGLRGRIGYEISPALIPFIEIASERMVHDLAIDSFGYRRDLTTYKAKAGAEIDLGEKLRGELAGGYARTDFQDNRLGRIAAFTLDGNATWSPRRGTDVAIGLATDFEPSTTAGVGGAVTYALRGEISQTVMRDLVARANATTTWRDYASQAIADQTVIATGAGLTWGLSRYLDLAGDVAWEVTRQKTGPESGVFRATLGLTLKR
jgi:hypothetical protein